MPKSLKCSGSEQTALWGLIAKESETCRAQTGRPQAAAFNWQHPQAGRGLLPAFNEVGLAGTACPLFTSYRSFEGIWEGTKFTFSPDFVEWVEEQRPKVA